MRGSKIPPQGVKSLFTISNIARDREEIENKEENLFSSNEEEIKKIDHEETEISRSEIESVLNNLNDYKISK
jgi:hypothetical protein